MRGGGGGAIIIIFVMTIFFLLLATGKLMDPFSGPNPLFSEGPRGGGRHYYYFPGVQALQKIMDPFSMSNPLFFEGREGGGAIIVFQGSRPSKK